MCGIDRVASLRTFIKNEKLDSFLISDPIDAEYICKLKSSNIYLLIKSDELFLFTDFRYQKVAEEICAISDWQFVLLDKDGLSMALEKSISIGEKVGFQSDIMTVAQFAKITKVLPEIKFQRYDNKIAELISSKNSDEINSIMKAASIGDSAYSEIVNLLKSGMTEKEVANLLEEFCRDGGSEKPSFDTIVLFGKRSSLPHGIPSDQKLINGDIVLIDFGCTVNGYCSDMTRSLVFGNSSDNQKEIYDIVNQARELAVNSVKSGIKASEIDRVARDYISTFGYGEFFGHGTGHGVGLRVHEFPSLNSKNKTILKEGMIITIEPGIYISEIGGIRIEDIVLVTKTGFKLITNSSREFIELHEGN